MSRRTVYRAGQVVGAVLGIAMGSQLAFAESGLYEPKDVAISADGRYVATVEFASKTKLWDFNSQRALWTHKSKGGGRMLTGAEAVDISPDGTKVVYGDNYDDRVVVLDSRTGNVIQIFPLSNKESVYEVAFSPDGKYVASSGSNITLWSLESGRAAAKLSLQKGSIRTLAFSPDGRYLASGSWDDSVVIWDLSTQQPLHHLKGHDDDVRTVAFSNDGRLLASGAEDRTFRIWDVRSGQLLVAKKAHTGGSFPSVNHVLFSPDDRFLLTTGSDQKVLMWSVESGDLVDEPYKPVGCVRGMDISGDGERVVVVSSGCTTSSPDVSRAFVEHFSLCCSNPDYAATMRREYESLSGQTALKSYAAFIKRFRNKYNAYYPERIKVLQQVEQRFGQLSEDAVTAMIRNGDLDGLNAYIRSDYMHSGQSARVFDATLDLLVRGKAFVGLTEFAQQSRISEKQKQRAIEAIYQIVASENNISGYKWFIETYPNTPSAVEAVKNMHKLAYGMAVAEGTVAAYNDFIIAFPFAEQVKVANETAYTLEKEEFDSWFTSDEKHSRALLVKSKQLERKARDLNGSQQTGYFLVVNRMNQMLQDMFPAEEATLRYLESEEFKDFYRDFKSSMRRIESALADIRSNTSGLSRLLRQQTEVMDNHFREAAQSRALSEKYTQQHRFWERYMKGQQS